MDRLDQNLDYYQSLLTDQLKDIKKEREEQRQQIEKILQSKIPQPLESLLTNQQTRLYRLYQMAPNQLKENERKEMKKIVEQLDRWSSGGSYNLTEEQEKFLKESGRLFSFKIPNINVTFSIDILGPIENELVNSKYKMVDIFIENIRYPFNEKLSQAYLDHLDQLKIDPLKFPKMRLSKLEKTEIEIETIMIQLDPEFIT